MSTSPLGGITLYDPADLETDEPVDTVLVRDEIVGSALHLADEAGQVRASWVALPGEPLEIVENVSTSGLLFPDAWYAFPLRARWAAKVRPNGTGYRLRVRLAGASEAGDAVDFGIIVSPRSASISDISAPDVLFETVEGITSTSAAWLGIASYIDVPPGVIASALRGVSTLTDLGGDRITVEVAELDVMIVGRTAANTSAAQLYGLHLAEIVATS